MYYESKDLEANGVPVQTTIIQIEFGWDVGLRHEDLKYGYTYRYTLNGKEFEFTRWEKVYNHDLNHKKNPKVNEKMIDISALHHPGDTLNLIVSKKTPSRHQIK
jgi:hypothetical protein